VPLGFCCGGFSSTAGYVPGNEALTLQQERHRALWLYLSIGCYLFLSKQLKKIFQFSLASLSASTRSVNSNYIPLVVALKQSVTALFASLRVGHKARKQFD
jgi:hypothetical protein